MNDREGFFTSRGLYYGWVIVAVALVSTGFWMGIRACFSVFYVALLEEFPWSRGESAGVQSLALMVYTLFAPLVGGLIDRFGPRRIILPGILILFLGQILSARIQDLLHFYLLYGVISGVGISCIAVVSYSAILAHWFEKKRGLASGIAVSGMGLGTFFLVPLCQQFILLWGWRVTFIATGILLLIILLPLNGIFLRHKPREMGLYSDGAAPPEPSVPGERKEAGSRRPPAIDWTLSKASKTAAFWYLLAFPFFSFSGIFLIFVHNVKFMVDQGISKMTAAFIFAMVGIISSIFRIFWGWLSDRIGREKTFTAGTLCACMGVGSLLIIGATGIKGFAYAFFILYGIGWGVTAPMFMAVSADLFKGRGFGLIYGMVEGGIGVAGALGAWLGGFVFDRTGSYQWAFILAILFFLLSILFVWLAAPRKANPVRG
ncbi:MAG: MFS transporter [Pseudomonadota bacterium]